MATRRDADYAEGGLTLLEMGEAPSAPAAAEMDQFAYDRQLCNLRDKYPLGYAQFKERNVIDVSKPTAALQRAKGALDVLLAAAREQEWGVAVSIEL